MTLSLRQILQSQEDEEVAAFTSRRAAGASMTIGEMVGDVFAADEEVAPEEDYAEELTPDETVAPVEELADETAAVDESAPVDEAAPAMEIADESAPAAEAAADEVSGSEVAETDSSA